MLLPLEIQNSHAKNIVVDNDFHQTHAIFSLFERLEVEDLDKPLVNGHQLNGNGHLLNGNGHQSNGNGHQLSGVHNHIANGVPKEVHI